MSHEKPEQNFKPVPKKVENYTESIMYRMLQGELEDKNYHSVLTHIQNLSKNPLMDQKHASMADILVQAYDAGDHSEALGTQLKNTVEEFFKELVAKGLIQSHNSGPVDGIEDNG